MTLEITVTDASKLINEKNTLLLDVRTIQEINISSLKDFVHIPLHELQARIKEIAKNKKVLVLCHHGNRSLVATIFLQKMGFDALSIRGGINAWAIEIDQQIPRYN